MSGHTEDVDPADGARAEAVSEPGEFALDASVSPGRIRSREDSTWDQLAAALEPLARSPRLLGVSVANFRPDLDPTGELAVRVVDVLERTPP